MKTGESPERNSQRGFTLTEIAVAVALLGIALTTLIGLHTQMLDIYVNERNRVQASLYAQYVLTMLEVAAEPPAVGSEEGELSDRLEELGFFAEDKDLKPDELLLGWEFSQDVSSVALPELEDALRRVDFSISWGESSEEELSLVYFINTEADTGASSGGIEDSARSTQQ